jgi:hypothetical protein
MVASIRTTSPRAARPPAQPAPGTTSFRGGSRGGSVGGSSGVGGWFLGIARWFAGTAGVVRLRWFRSMGYLEVA